MWTRGPSFLRNMSELEPAFAVGQKILRAPSDATGADHHECNSPTMHRGSPSMCMDDLTPKAHVHNNIFSI
jgi:hypothetical protein